MESGAAAPPPASAGAAPPTAPPTDSALWVDKYSPHTFSELLSSESLNRDVLRWIKCWDPVVFGRPGPQGLNFEGGGGGGGGGGSGEGGKLHFTKAPRTAASSAPSATATAAGAAAPPVTTVADLFGPTWNANARALLLVGPPGSGKTTLAHVVAAHAGYRVREVNASDDRSKAGLREVLSAASTSQSVFGDKRPVLVVLDEIDGMEGAAVADLVKILKGSTAPLGRGAGGGRRGGGGGAGEGAEAQGEDSAPSAAGGAAAGAGAGAGGAAAAAPSAGKKRARAGAPGAAAHASSASASAPPSLRLSRPLLCICNDQFAPALRELRGLVQVVEFAKADPEKLLARLRAITASEGLSLPRDALVELATLTDYDVRSCLHTLQYLKGHCAKAARDAAAAAAREAAATGAPLPPPFHHRSRITKDALLAAAVGAKDQTRALFDVWNAVFKTPSTRWVPKGGGAAAAGSSSSSSSSSSTHSAYREELFTTASGFSTEPGMLLAGLHENLLSSRAADPTLAGTVSALEWLCYGTELTHRALSRQLYSMLKYFPASVLGVHLRASSELRTAVKWPRLESGFRGAREGKRSVLSAYLGGRGVGVRVAGGGGGGSGGLCIVSPTAVVLDFVSPLVTMALCPPLRPISFTLMNSKERTLALDVVEVRGGTCLLPIFLRCFFLTLW